MMKKIKTICCIITISTSILLGQNAHAKGCQLVYGGYKMGEIFHGPTKCENTTIENLQVVGTLTLKNTIINGTLTMTGQVRIENSTINKTKLKGYLSAKNTVFKTVLDLNTSQAKLSQCKTKNIMMTSKTPSKAKLMLNASVINGNIGFPYENGRVILTNGARVEGKVIGGTLIQQ